MDPGRSVLMDPGRSVLMDPGTLGNSPSWRTSIIAKTLDCSFPTTHMRYSKWSARRLADRGASACPLLQILPPPSVRPSFRPNARTNKHCYCILSSKLVEHKGSYLFSPSHSLHLPNT